jgi:predicted site-specific integrase-resolvase
MNIGDDSRNVLSDYMDSSETAAQLTVSVRTLERWRRLDEGPPITKMGKKVLYRRSSVEAWLRAREISSLAA